ncbi:MAG: anti-sigma factor family protein [Anaerolineales bacterium]
MSKERGQTQELNQLSAYLDDALSGRERRAFEARLQVEPELRQKLENLRSTKYLLNHLKPVRAPRNFTLSPEMVKVRRKKRQPFFGALRFATSLAAILLVVLFGVEMLFGERLATLPRNLSEPQMETATSLDEETPEPLILWGEGNLAESGGGIGYGGGEESVAEAPQMEEQTAPKEPESIEEALPEEQPQTAPEEELLPEAAFEEETLDLKRQADENLQPILGLNPEAGGKVITQSEPGAMAEEVAQPWMSTLRLGQIILAIIALGGGVALWLLRNKYLH